MKLLAAITLSILSATAIAHPHQAANPQGVVMQQQGTQQQGMQQPGQNWGCQPQQPTGNVVTRTADAAKNQAEAEVQHEARRRVNRAFGKLFGR